MKTHSSLCSLLFSCHVNTEKNNPPLVNSQTQSEPAEGRLHQAVWRLQPGQRGEEENRGEFLQAFCKEASRWLSVMSDRWMSSSLSRCRRRSRTIFRSGWRPPNKPWCPSRTPSTRWSRSSTARRRTWRPSLCSRLRSAGASLEILFLCAACSQSALSSFHFAGRGLLLGLLRGESSQGEAPRGEGASGHSAGVRQEAEHAAPGWDRLAWQVRVQTVTSPKFSSDCGGRDLNAPLRFLGYFWAVCCCFLLLLLCLLPQAVSEWIAEEAHSIWGKSSWRRPQSGWKRYKYFSLAGIFLSWPWNWLCSSVCTFLK